MSDRSGRGNGAIVVIDESIAKLDSGEIYIVAAAVVAPSTERDSVTLNARTALRSGSATRKRPFHWTDEGPAVRTAMVDVLTHRAVSVISCQSELISPRHFERARIGLMGSLIEAACERENVELVLFESREKDLRAVGQNRSDHEVITAARHAGVVPYSAHYDWIDKSEPLCWLADAAAGAVNRNVCGDPNFTDRLDTWFDITP